MKRSTPALLFAMSWLAVGPSAARAQFKPEEIAQRPFQEEFLLTAEIVRAEPIGEGVTRPYKLLLRKDGLEAKAAWKNPHGVQLGYLEGWQYEIAAYRLDKLIALNMVPVAVERAFEGKPGALVWWVTSKHSLLEIAEKGIKIPDEFLEHTEKMKWLARAWDSLVANDDRTQQNVLYTEDWRMILIDHSRAFRSTDEHMRRLMFGRRGLKMSQQGTPWLFRKLPRWFVDALRGLTFETIRTAVGTTLTDREIRAILARRELLLQEIAEMVKEQGEAAVIY